MVGEVSSDLFAFQPLGEDDLPYLLEIRNECRGVLHDDRSFTLPECEAWFHATRPDFHIIRYHSERIGYFRLSDHDPGAASISIGADLHRDYRGRGLARAAYEAFLPIVKERYRVSTATLEVLSHNTVALGLYEKLGFVEINRRPGVTTRNGILVDSIVMVRDL